MDADYARRYRAIMPIIGIETAEFSRIFVARLPLAFWRSLPSSILRSAWQPATADRGASDHGSRVAQRWNRGRVLDCEGPPRLQSVPGKFGKASPSSAAPRR